MKARLLLAMAACYLPALWEEAAVHRFREARHLGRYRDVASVGTWLLRKAEGGVRKRAVSRHLVRARRTEARAAALLASGNYAEAFAAADALAGALVDAYAATVPSAPRDEMRGVWDHAGTGLYPGDWPRTCALLADAGLTDIFTNVAWPGRAHYRSRTSSLSETCGVHGDQLAQAVEAARPCGLRVHAWKVCWNLERAPADFVARMTREKRLQVDDAGCTRRWLCPSVTANVELEAASIRELAAGYALDGIHLDYIRFPDSHACYCASCRRAFEAELGRVVAPWPAAVRQPALLKTYRAWKCRQITRFVKRVRQEVDAARPGTLVSAAVYGKYPSCVDSVSQDWVSWIRAGYVDVVCPMNYTDSLDRFRLWAGTQRALVGTHGKLLPGIGVLSASSRLDPIQVLDQIQAQRMLKAHGYVLFELNDALATHILPRLKD